MPVARLAHEADAGVQWTDPATLALVAHLARLAAGAPLLLVGAFRDVEVDAAHPLAQLVDALARDDRLEQIAGA